MTKTILTLDHELRCRELLTRGRIILEAGTVADGRIYTLTTDLLATVAAIIVESEKTSRENQPALLDSLT